jgi:hypothetical protein
MTRSSLSPSSSSLSENRSLPVSFSQSRQPRGLKGLEGSAVPAIVLVRKHRRLEFLRGKSFPYRPPMRGLHPRLILPSENSRTMGNQESLVPGVNAAADVPSLASTGITPAVWAVSSTRGTPRMRRGGRAVQVGHRSADVAGVGQDDQVESLLQRPASVPGSRRLRPAGHHGDRHPLAFQALRGRLTRCVPTRRWQTLMPGFRKPLSTMFRDSVTLAVKVKFRGSHPALRKGSDFMRQSSHVEGVRSPEKRTTRARLAPRPQEGSHGIATQLGFGTWCRVVQVVCVHGFHIFSFREEELRSGWFLSPSGLADPANSGASLPAEISWASARLDHSQELSPGRSGGRRSGPGFSGEAFRARRSWVNKAPGYGRQRRDQAHIGHLQDAWEGREASGSRLQSVSFPESMSRRCPARPNPSRPCRHGSQVEIVIECRGRSLSCHMESKTASFSI